MSEGWGQPQEQDPWAQGAPAASGWGDAAQAPSQQYALPSQDEMFGAPSVPSFSFDAPVGTELGGVITELPPAVQKRDFDSKEPLFWNNGRPRWIWPVVCATDMRDANIQYDDGQRSHYLEYKRLDAVKKAVQAAGATKLEVGGELYIKYVGGGPKDSHSPYASSKAKVYEARYRTAAQRGDGVPAPVAQAPAAPVADIWEGLNPAAVAELQGYGLQPHQVLPHVRHLQGWTGAPAQAILGKLPHAADDPVAPF